MERENNIMNGKQHKVWESLLDKYDVVSSETEIEITDGIAAVEAWNYDKEDTFNRKDYTLTLIKENGKTF